MSMRRAFGGALLLAIAVSLTLFGGLLGRSALATHPGTTVLVGDATPGDDGASPYSCGDAGNPCDTIQHGVDHASSGDTVSLAADTYVEQVVIDKPLTLAGNGAVVESPVTLTEKFSTGFDNFPIVYVHDASAVTISDLVVDGAGNGNDNYRFMGIAYVNAGGTISGVTVTDVRSTPFSGIQHGVGIFAHADSDTPRVLTIEESDITGYQKAGMVLSGSSLTVDLDDNVVVGEGPTAVIDQIGVQLGFGAGGSLTANAISGNIFTPGTIAAAGVLLIEAAPGVSISSLNSVSGNSEGLYVQESDDAVVTGNEIESNVGTNVFSFLSNGGTYELNTFSSANVGLWLSDSSGAMVSENTFTANDHGIVLEGDSVGTQILTNDIISNTGTSSGIHIQSFEGESPSGTEIHFNDILDNDAVGGYGVFNSTSTDIDATDNDWGACSGPSGVGIGKGDAVTERVIYQPWLFDAHCPPDGDLDGDSLTNSDEILVYGTNPQVADSDGDGCDDGRELGASAAAGGGRDPTSYWDFGDMPIASASFARNRFIQIADITAVVSRFGTDDGGGFAEVNRNTDPLSTPPVSGYHPAFDGGGQAGPNVWDQLPADGSIRIPDIVVIVAQFGHDCR